MQRSSSAQIPSARGQGKQPSNPLFLIFFFSFILPF
jgi:hypothetical protein